MAGLLSWSKGGRFFSDGPNGGVFSSWAKGGGVGVEGIPSLVIAVVAVAVALVVVAVVVMVVVVMATTMVRRPLGKDQR